ncbi:UNVERIFIED_CONTAM: hypothetical protein K2H54_027275 [Gekko kuhli]
MPSNREKLRLGEAWKKSPASRRKLVGGEGKASLLKSGRRLPHIPGALGEARSRRCNNNNRTNIPLLLRLNRMSFAKIPNVLGEGGCSKKQLR